MIDGSCCLHEDDVDGARPGSGRSLGGLPAGEARETRSLQRVLWEETVSHDEARRSPAVMARGGPVGTAPVPGWNVPADWEIC